MAEVVASGVVGVAAPDAVRQAEGPRAAPWAGSARDAAGRGAWAPAWRPGGGRARAGHRGDDPAEAQNAAARWQAAVATLGCALPP